MKPEDIVAAMMAKDYFSQWLDIKVLAANEGNCTLSLRVRNEMLNGFGIAHGGITYSLADSALAFASNSKGRQSLSIETSISHITSLKENDVITAVAVCITETEKLGHYEVKVFTIDQKKPVALFKGIVYKTSRNWVPSQESE